MNKNAKMLLENGETFYNLGRLLLKVWAFAWCLFTLTIIISAMIGGGESIGYVLSFTVDDKYWFVIPLIGLSYLGILIGAAGPVLYFNGLHLIGLGQIAMNTEDRTKTAGSRRPNMFDDLPSL